MSATPGRSLVWADPFSLAATYGIEVSLFSCRYLDVSVPYVRFRTLCIRVRIPLRVGFPIQTSQDHSLVTSSPGLFAGSHVFHRLLTPRHPPYALISLIMPTSNRRTGSRPTQPVMPRFTARQPGGLATAPSTRQAPQSSIFIYSVCTYVQLPSISTCQRTSSLQRGFYPLPADAACRGS